MDGKRYYGLKGDEIPFESRIIAIADTFSALRTYRIYRSAKTIQETKKILNEIKGNQLDEEILGYFLSLDIKTLENLECNCAICRQRRKALEEKLKMEQ
jgi:HD-GYP domain-containing protein (c-di-GMP phosphodiesterase class II)